MKPIISLVEPENASETARAAAEAHLAKGYRLTNEKRTLLHNAVAFNALEDMSYAVSAEMKKFTGSRAARPTYSNTRFPWRTTAWSAPPTTGKPWRPWVLKTWTRWN